MRRNTEELIAAYVDGVSELSAAERARVEALVASDPDARAERDATRAVVDQLRALPPSGQEPDWAALAQRIELAVGPSVPRVWWRSWRWVVPVGALAVASIAAIWFVHRVPVETPVAVVPVAAHDAGIAVTHPPEQPTEQATVQLWLDGESVEVGDRDAAQLLDDLFDDQEPEAPVADEHGLLPTTDLGWVDNLDDASIERAEHWLASHGTKKKG